MVDFEGSREGEDKEGWREEREEAGKRREGKEAEKREEEEDRAREEGDEQVLDDMIDGSPFHHHDRSIRGTSRLAHTHHQPQTHANEPLCAP